MTPDGGGAARGRAWLAAHPRAVVTAALLAVPVLLMREALTGQGALYQRDVHLYWHPQAEAFVRAIAAGAWPVWDPTVGFGQAFLANSSAQVLYPITWLNLVIRPWWYYTLFVFAHLVLSAFGAYAAARRLGCSRFAAVTGAMVWTACGPFVSLTILWHHFAGAAWLPWIVAGSHRLAAERTGRATVALGVILGLQQLAGSFEMATMGAFVAAAWAVEGMSWPRPWASVSDRRLVVRFAGAMALAVALSAGQWMATVEAAAHSGRRSLPREVRTYWSVHPLTLVDLVLPGFSAGAPVSEATRKELFESREPFLPSIYLGLPALLLVLAGLADAGRRRLSLFLAASIVLVALVSLGRHTPAYDVLVTALPPLKAFRYPVKVMVLVALAWSLLAALGADAWRNAARDRRALHIRNMAAVATALAALACVVLLASGSERAARNAGLAATLAAIGAAASAWKPLAARSRLVPAAVTATVAVADLLLYHRSVNDVSPIGLYTHRPEVLAHIDPAATSRLYAYDYSVKPVAGGDPPPLSAQRLERMPAGWPVGPSMALAQQMALAPMSGGRWGLRGSYEVDYTGLFPVHVNQAAYYLRSREGTADHRRLLQLGGVTHVVATHDAPFGDLDPAVTIPGLFEAPIRLFSVPDPMPIAYVASTTREGEGLGAIRTLVDPAFDFRTAVLVPPRALLATPGGPGAARIAAAAPDRMSVEVRAPHGGYLVVLESYDPGWRATVDGAAAEIVPANVLFRGIRLAPGARVVELVYRPPGLVAGLIVSALAAAATSILAWRLSARHGAARA